jgi:hypothetical protein
MFGLRASTLAVAAGVVTVAGILAACGNDDGDNANVQAAEPGLWVASLVPGSDWEEGALPVGDIRLMKAGTDDDILVAEGGPWVALALSPGATHVAAIRRSGNGTVRFDGVDIFAVGEPVGTRLQLDGGTTPSLAWSPDGSMLAVAQSDGVLVVDLSGDSIGRLSSPSGGPAGGSFSWSPAGRMFAFTNSESVVVGRPNGAPVATSALDAMYAAAGVNDRGEQGYAFAGEWLDEESLLAVGSVGPDVGEPGLWEFHGRVVSGALEWTAEAIDEPPAWFPGGMSPDWAREVLGEDVVGQSGRLTPGGVTGSAALSHPDGRPLPGRYLDGTRVSLVVSANSEVHRIDVDIDPDWVFRLRDIPWWDAVLVEAR